LYLDPPFACILNDQTTSPHKDGCLSPLASVILSTRESHGPKALHFILHFELKEKKRMSNQDVGLIGLVEVPKKQAQVILEAGYFYMEKGEFQLAEEVFKGCASLLPRSEVPHLGLGHLYQSQGKMPQSLASLQQAHKLRPNSAEVNAFLGEAHLLMKQFDKAMPFLNKAQELDQSDPPAAADLARNLLDAYKEGVFG
jgi:tetratricopeptide (TPR) repeat protein